MDGAEFDSLVADVKANGLRHPIVLHDGMILDGGNRYRACIAAGIEPEFVNFDGDSIVAFVLSANLHRRHMTPGQQAAIVASAQDWAKAQTHGGDRKSDRAASLPLDSVASRAAQSGAGERTQRLADKVAKSDPELAKQVARGETSLPAAVERITGKRPGKRPPAKQSEPLHMVTPDGEVLTEGDAHAEESAQDLLDELQRDNDQLNEQIKILTATDTKAELHKMILQRDHAVRQQGDAMDRAVREQKAHAFKHRQLVRCGKAVGEEDPTKIAAAVEAFVRQYRKAA